MTAPLASPPAAAQPVGRGWTSLGGAAVIVGVVLFGVIGWSAYQQSFSPDDNNDNKEKQTINVYQPPDLPRVQADTGYARKPEPIAAQPVTIAQPAPVAPTTPMKALPNPPQPMLSGFVGKMSPDIENSTTVASREQMTEGYGQSGEYRPGAGDSKNAQWLAEAGTGGRDYVTEPFMPPISEFMIQTGITIEARLLHKVSSALPGDVVAQITSHVCDTPTGKYELIPATAKLFGRYSDNISYGQDRAQIAWNRILFPDGSSQNIGSFAGVDADGAAGVTGHVNRHIGGLAAAVGISTLSTMIGQAGQIIQGDGSSNTNIGVIGGNAAGQKASDIGERIADKELNRPNTIELCRNSNDQTCNVAILVSKDIALPPYHARGCF